MIRQEVSSIIGPERCSSDMQCNAMQILTCFDLRVGGGSLPVASGEDPLAHYCKSSESLLSNCPGYRGVEFLAGLTERC